MDMGAPNHVGRVAQNAGCMMAIHANCTKPKMCYFFNLLIYNDFSIKQ